VLLSSISRASQRTVDFAFLLPSRCVRAPVRVWPPSFETEREMIFEVVSDEMHSLSPRVLDLVGPRIGNGDESALHEARGGRLMDTSASALSPR